MTTVKEKAHEIVDRLPADAGWEDLVREILVRQKIEEGLQDIAEGRVTPHEEVKRRFVNP